MPKKDQLLKEILLRASSDFNELVPVRESRQT